MHVRRYSRKHSDSFDGDEVSSSAWKSRTDPVPCPIDVQCASIASFSRTEKDFMEQVTESDPTKAQLLEALCHSQTRAREAEKAAKQAYAETEHVIKLIFKQASQIYAHKLWFKMLQLDALHLQIKNNEQPVSRSRKSLQKTRKARQGKQSQPRPSITTCAAAFALGLSLVGAGLLLGWTVGRMLPL
ncbi:hypothetical protein GQ457_05G000950 [Hibiscus cannabinus]